MNIKLPVTIKIGDMEIKGKILSEKYFPDNPSIVELEIRYPNMDAVIIDMLGEGNDIRTFFNSYDTMRITVDTKKYGG